VIVSAVDLVSAREQVFAPLNFAGAAETIVRRIGEAIGSGVLAPGERLPPEGALAAMLGVAPMTLRQAMGVLREAGFVETRRGRTGGTFVARNPRGLLAPAPTPPTAAEWRELTTWRRAVSGEAAAQAARAADAKDRRWLVTLAGAVDEATTSFPAFRRADSRFHIALAEVSANRRLISAEAAIQAELGEILRSVPAPILSNRLSSAGHAPILRAVADADPHAARVAMEQHVESTNDWIVGLRLGLA
jgi:DNA-binding FadR family transcriptional regulator